MDTTQHSAQRRSRRPQRMTLGRRRWPVVALMIALVVAVSLGATQATVTFLARSQPLRLDPARLQRLATLRKTVEPRLLSPISPDDTTVVTVALPEAGRGGTEPGTPTMAFLNIQDGSSQPIDAAALKVVPETDVVWRDARTAAYISADQAGSPLLVELDRASGTVISTTLRLPGRPISLAPNASRVLTEIGGTASATLAAYDVASGAVEPLLSYPAGGAPSAVAWTPDGAKLALIRLALPPHLAGDGQRLTELQVQDALGELPPADNPVLQGNVVDVFDLARRAFHPAALKAADGDGALFRQLRWSPDGSMLLAHMARPATLAGQRHPVYQYLERGFFRFYDAHLVLQRTLERPELAAVESTSASFVSPHTLALVAPDGMTLRLFAFQYATGELRPLPTPDGSFAPAPQGYQLHATQRSGQLVFTHSSFQRPPEVYRIGVDGTGLQALTQLNTTAAAANRIRVDPLSVPLADGTTRSGYLLQPEGAAFPPRNARIVLFQQGGPGGAMTNRWGTRADEPFNVLPNFGLAVLVMSFSGREGFGPAFANRLYEGRNFGQLDIDEAAEVVAYLRAQGAAAPAGVGITGCSYGGYFALQSVIRHPDQYAAAVAQCAVVDVNQVWAYISRPTAAHWEGRRPTAGAAEYTRDSPLHQAEQIRTPLLLVHGRQDPTPLSSIRELRDRVAASGTPVELLAFGDEGHELSNPSSQMAANQAMIRWFELHLARRDQPATAALRGEAPR